MSTTRSNEEVIRSFIKGSRAGWPALVTNGEALMSYGSVIALRDDAGGRAKIRQTKAGPGEGRTTGAHRRLLTKMMHGDGNGKGSPELGSRGRHRQSHPRGAVGYHQPAM